MKKLALGAICLSVVAGCASAPQSTAELRAMSGGAMVEKKSTLVSRSPGQVYASLSRGAKKCLNTSQSQHISRATAYGGWTHTIGHAYEGRFRRTGGKGELSILKATSGAIVPGAKDGMYIAYVVDAVPVSGGTRLDVYGGRFGYGELNAAVTQWAKGGAFTCPALP